MLTEGGTLMVAAEEFGYPLVLKARFGGFDGRGNAVVQSETEIDRTLQGFNKQPLYEEQFIPFAHELALIVARDLSGEVATYPVLETIQENSICHMVLAPAPLDAELLDRADILGQQVIKRFQGQ